MTYGFPKGNKPGYFEQEKTSGSFEACNKLNATEDQVAWWYARKTEARIEEHS